MRKRDVERLFTKAGIGPGDLGLKINETLEQEGEIIDDLTLGEPVLNWIIDQLSDVDITVEDTGTDRMPPFSET